VCTNSRVHIQICLWLMVVCVSVCVCVHELACTIHIEVTCVGVNELNARRRR
jgi:hypothetical protein